MATRIALPLFVGLLAYPPAPAVAEGASIPVGTPVWVKSQQTVRMRVGQEIHGELMYPVFAANKRVLPTGTVVDGVVTGMEADHAHRMQARLRGDFTPFSHPVVLFQRVHLPDGSTFALPAGPARDGAPVLRLTPPPPRKGGFVRREFDTGVGMVKDRVRLVTAPGKKDRLTALLYGQLPYHPQRVDAGTVRLRVTLLYRRRHGRGRVRSRRGICTAMLWRKSLAMRGPGRFRRIWRRR